VREKSELCSSLPSPLTDRYNDQTFGAADAPNGNNLPSFFLNPGSSVVDQLANWSLEPPPGMGPPPGMDAPPGMEPFENGNRSHLYANASDYSNTQGPLLHSEPSNHFLLEQILITRSVRFPLLLLQMHLPHSLLVRELMMITRKLLLEIWSSNKCNSSNDI
jgi:hypothetical protein